MSSPDKYNVPDWMTPHITSDVQSAIQSQSIQTALESNTSKITDTGFQSFLTSAPIPRFFVGEISGTYNSATNTIVTWAASTYVDPYRMLVPATGIATMPIDGFYTFVFSMQAVAGAAGALNLSYYNTPGGTLAANTVDFVVGDTAKYNGQLCYVAPLRQADTVRVNIGNSTVGAISSFPTGSWGCSWVAPYFNYQGGN